MNISRNLLMCICLVLMVGCNKTDENIDKSSPILDRNNYVLEINRISERPDVQFPTDALTENNYEEVNEGLHYAITISSNGQTITIEPGAITGRRLSDIEESLFFELDGGVFAEGRFIVWTTENNIEAELTIYGSGVPIIKSERGYLFPE